MRAYRPTNRPADYSPTCYSYTCDVQPISLYEDVILTLFQLLSSKLFFLVCVSCRKQEDLVQNVRRRLEEALMADMLAHIEDTAADAAANKVEEKVEQVDKEEL